MAEDVAEAGWECCPMTGCAGTSSVVDDMKCAAYKVKQGRKAGWMRWVVPKEASSGMAGGKCGDGKGERE